MYMLNRKQRYELIKKLITDTNIPNDLKYGDIKKQLLEYLDEMHICWNKNYFDMTDKQYIKIITNDDEKNHIDNLCDFLFCCFYDNVAGIFIITPVGGTFSWCSIFFSYGVITIILRNRCIFLFTPFHTTN